MEMKVFYIKQIYKTIRKLINLEKETEERKSEDYLRYAYMSGALRAYSKELENLLGKLVEELKG